ncbi:MAG TPA: cation diffusion facilitator family transporter [Alphaproteobacteria bacterium]|nr:cation diffusion facilitator family transporter [Alphaproteobacteria bacterium]
MTQNALHDERLIKRATYAAVSTASVLIGMKLFAWWVTNSVSLQASLIDSLLDAFASLVNMIAIFHALKPADKVHRFGYGKAESLAALGQALFIGGSSLWLFYAAYDRLVHRQPVESTEVGVVVMGIAIVITLILVTFQKYVVKKTKSSAIAADMIHYRSDLLTNSAVIVSLLCAKWFHVKQIDPIFGLFIGGYILWSAWKIMMQAYRVLMDRELDHEERVNILAIIKSHPEVLDVRDLRTRSSGLHQFFQLHLLMKPELSLRDADRIAEEVEAEVIQAYPKSQVLIRLVPEIPEPPKEQD